MISLVTLLSFLLDQLTKYFSTDLAGLGFGFCRFSTPTTNISAAFSIQIPNALLAGFTAFILVFILVWIRRQPALDTLPQISLGLILGGGMSNLLDRLFYGGVTDFISCSFWPTFNFADIFITVGVVLLLIFSIQKSK